MTYRTLIVDTIAAVAKHLAGLHNQKKHGVEGGAGRSGAPLDEDTIWRKPTSEGGDIRSLSKQLGGARGLSDVQQSALKKFYEGANPSDMDWASLSMLDRYRVQAMAEEGIEEKYPSAEFLPARKQRAVDKIAQLDVDVAKGNSIFWSGVRAKDKATDKDRPDFEKMNRGRTIRAEAKAKQDTWSEWGKGKLTTSVSDCCQDSSNRFPSTMVTPVEINHEGVRSTVNVCSEHVAEVAKGIRESEPAHDKETPGRSNKAIVEQARRIVAERALSSQLSLLDIVEEATGKKNWMRAREAHKEIRPGERVGRTQSGYSWLKQHDPKILAKGEERAAFLKMSPEERQTILAERRAEQVGAGEQTFVRPEEVEKLKQIAAEGDKKREAATPPAPRKTDLPMVKTYNPATGQFELMPARVRQRRSPRGGD